MRKLNITLFLLSLALQDGIYAKTHSRRVAKISTTKGDNAQALNKLDKSISASSKINDLNGVGFQRKFENSNSVQLSWQHILGIKPLNIVSQYGALLGNLNLQGIFTITPRWNLEFYLSGAFAAGTISSEVLKSASVFNHLRCFEEQEYRPQISLGLNVTVSDYSQRLGTYLEFSKSVWDFMEFRLSSGLMYGLSMQGSDYLNVREQVQVWAHGQHFLYARAEIGFQQITLLDTSKPLLTPDLYQPREGVIGHNHFLIGLGSHLIPQTRLEIILVHVGPAIIDQNSSYNFGALNIAYQF